MRSNNNNSRAFSLPELLVTVGVIGILAGLLLPALSRGRESGKAAVCASNLRQLAIASQLYWDDNGGRAFRYRTYSTNGGDLYWFGWLQRGSEGHRSFDHKLSPLAPYLNERGVEICPSLQYRSAKFKLKATGAAYGYGYNLHLSPLSDSTSKLITALPSPATTLLLADAAQVNAFQPPATPENPMLEEFYYVTRDEPTVHFRHGAHAQAAFCDTHVEKRKMVPGSADLRMPGVGVGKLPPELFGH